MNSRRVPAHRYLSMWPTKEKPPNMNYLFMPVFVLLPGKNCKKCIFCKKNQNWTQNSKFRLVLHWLQILKKHIFDKKCLKNVQNVQIWVPHFFENVRGGWRCDLALGLLKTFQGLPKTPPGLPKTPKGLPKTTPGSSEDPPGSSEDPPKVFRRPPKVFRRPPQGLPKTPQGLPRNSKGLPKTPPRSSGGPTKVY